MKNDTPKTGSSGRPRSSRDIGVEVRAVKWFARHPIFVVLPIGFVAAWWYGRLLVTTCSLGGLVVAVAVWGRAHPDTFDWLAAPRLRAMWRRWTVYRGRRWVNLARDCELTRENPVTGVVRAPRIVRVLAPTPSIETIDLRMVRGQTQRIWVEQLETLAHGLEVERVSLVHAHKGRIRVSVERRNPFEFPIPAPVIPDTAGEVDLTALELGEDEFGGISTVPLIGGGGHMLGAGATGSGKSGLFWSPLRSAGPAIRDGFVRVHMCDFKGGMETHHAESLFTTWADNPRDGLTVIQHVRDLMKAKQVQAREEGRRKGVLSRDFPVDWLILDEIAMLTALSSDSKLMREAIRLLAEIGTQGRSVLCSMWAFLQEPLKDVLPIRDLFTTRVCLAVSSASHVDAVLGADMRDRGALADQIPLDPQFVGIGFRVNERSRAIHRIRAGNVTDADIAELVRTCSPQPRRLVVVGEDVA